MEGAGGAGDQKTAIARYSPKRGQVGARDPPRPEAWGDQGRRTDGAPYVVPRDRKGIKGQRSTRLSLGNYSERSRNLT